jgi:NDP-sugar pyrophosphorylase family protein
VNRPFLAYQLALLRDHGVTDVILACSYRVDDVRQALGDASDLGLTLRYVVEDEPRGTGGGVRNAADLAAGTVFVMNGDILTDVDLTALRHFHEARGSRTTIYLTRVEDPRQYGLVETGPDGRLLRFREKPGPDETITTDTVNAGIYLIDAALLARMPADRVVSIEREFFPALIADGIPCFGWVSPAYWRDIGSPAAYRSAQLDLLTGRARSALMPPGERGDGIWRGPGTRVAPGATLESPSALGKEVQIEAGARVGPLTVLGAGSRVGNTARVAGAIVWERVEIGEGAVLQDCIVGTGSRIGAHARLDPGVVLGSGAVVPPGTHVSG